MASYSAVPPPGRRPRMAVCSFSRVVDQVGYQLRLSIEAHHHGLVVPGADTVCDELDGGLLLESEALPNAVAGIDQDGQAQRKVGFGGELQNGLRPCCLLMIWKSSLADR